MLTYIRQYLKFVSFRVIATVIFSTFFLIIHYALNQLLESTLVFTMLLLLSFIMVVVFGSRKISGVKIWDMVGLGFMGYFLVFFLYL